MNTCVDCGTLLGTPKVRCIKCHRLRDREIGPDGPQLLDRQERTFGRICFEKFFDLKDGVAWDQMTPAHRQLWENAAQAVVAAQISGRK